MYTKHFLFLMLFVFFCLNTASAQGIQKGLWEITIETEMEGAPMKIPPMTNQACVTSDKYIPDNPEKNTNCKMVSSKQEGNTLAWKSICKDKESTIESTGKMIYSGNTFVGNMNTKIIQNGENINTKTTMKGKYLGPCK
ncbi:MAG TPA: DUF3617 family protein [Nitrospirae bacterium]|nr:DUF3617 family protein [Nitrospirota bacterium]